jgi:hypothetical protein
MQPDHQRCQYLLILRQHHWLMRPDHQHQIIPLRPIMLMQPKRLAQQSLNPIPPRRIPNGAGNADPQPRMRQLIGPGIANNRPPRLPHLRLKHGRKFGSAANPLRLAKRVTRFRHATHVRPQHVFDPSNAARSAVVKLDRHYRFAFLRRRGKDEGPRAQKNLAATLGLRSTYEYSTGV